MTKTIFVAIEEAPIERLELEATALVADLIERLRKRNPDHADLLIFAEDEDEPLGSEAALNGKDAVILHAHRNRAIEVTVSYIHHVFNRKFAPGATIAKVTKWATKQAGLEKAEAEEHVLQVVGTRVQPPKNAHLGSLAPKGGTVALELVRKQLVQG